LTFKLKHFLIEETKTALHYSWACGLLVEICIVFQHLQQKFLIINKNTSHEIHCNTRQQLARWWKYTGQEYKC